MHHSHTGPPAPRSQTPHLGRIAHPTQTRPSLSRPDHRRPPPCSRPNSLDGLDLGYVAARQWTGASRLLLPKPTQPLLPHGPAVAGSSRRGGRSATACHGHLLSPSATRPRNRSCCPGSRHQPAPARYPTVDHSHRHQSPLLRVSRPSLTWSRDPTQISAAVNPSPSHDPGQDAASFAKRPPGPCTPSFSHAPL